MSSALQDQCIEQKPETSRRNHQTYHQTGWTTQHRPHHPDQMPAEKSVLLRHCRDVSALLVCLLVHDNPLS
jgi:hypothetical protein